MRKRVWPRFEKGWQKDLGILGGFILLFLLLEWRLFAVGSEAQLFLYGDNLSTLNNLFSLFHRFSLRDLFGTVVGEWGMMGSYPLAEPQGSIFYLPITVLLLFFQLVPVTPDKLYYSLLLLHTLHFLGGTFLVYKFIQKFVVPDRWYGVLGGLTYMGLGWNVAWFGTATLSFMVGVLPLVFFTFFLFLRFPTLRHYVLFVFSLSLLLFAGGIVNFFFYVVLNLALLYLALWYFGMEESAPERSPKGRMIHFAVLLLGAPLLALLSYSVQLYTTYRVSQDVFHSPSTYGYLAYFGTHLYDLIGFLIPKFGLLNFGSTANPTIVWEFSLANILYVGLLPLLVLGLGLAFLRQKSVLIFAGLMLLNFLLSFGGAFFLYDLTFFFPGNELFRGHYKYLLVAGFYLAVLVPLILWQLWRLGEELPLERTRKALLAFLALLLVLGVIASLAAFTLKYLGQDMAFLNRYYSLALTFSSYLYRIVLIGGLSWLALSFFMRYRTAPALVFFALVLILDTSINYKYSVFSGTTLTELASKEFFECCEGKTIINDIEKYSQLYFIPEILGVDPFFQYSAIPNGHLVEYNSHIGGGASIFSYPLLAAAGIDGVLTTRMLPDPRFVLEKEKRIGAENYKELYLYNANGDIHNDWGSRPEAIGQTISYYRVPDAKDAFFTTEYKEKSSEKGAWEYVKDKEFDQFIPVIVDANRGVREKGGTHFHADVEFLENAPTRKRIAVKNGNRQGLLFVNIPYAGAWRATIAGKETPIYQANGAFSAVKINTPDAEVVIEVEKRPHYLALLVSAMAGALLLVLWWLPESSQRRLADAWARLKGR